MKKACLRIEIDYSKKNRSGKFPQESAPSCRGVFFSAQPSVKSGAPDTHKPRNISSDAAEMVPAGVSTVSIIHEIVRQIVRQTERVRRSVARAHGPVIRGR